MGNSIVEFLGSPFDEAVDERRYSAHVNFVPNEVLTTNLSAQSYRKEIVAAIQDLSRRFKCKALESVCAERVRQGSTPIYGDKGIPCVKPQHVQHLIVDLERETDKVVAKCVTDNPHSLLDKEAVLVNRSGAFTIGRSALYDGSQTAFQSEHVFKCVPCDSIDGAFLACFLNSWWGKRGIEVGIAGSTGQLQLPQSHISQVPVPLFDRSLQEAVGNHLRKAIRLRELAAIANGRIVESLSRVLGTPANDDRHLRSFWIGGSDLRPYRINPSEYHPWSMRAETYLVNNWDAVVLKDALVSPRDLSNGATPKGATYQTDGIGFLRVQNVRANRLDVSDLVCINSATDLELKRSRIRARDVVMTITGYPGTACCIQEDDLPLNTNQHSVRFHLKDEWNPFFVAAFINSPWGEAQVARRAIGGTREALDYPSVLSLVIPRVAREIQDRIGDLARDYASFLKDSPRQLLEAKQSCEDLILGNCDEDQLLAEGQKLAEWLSKNQIPESDVGK